MELEGKVIAVVYGGGCASCIAEDRTATEVAESRSIKKIRIDGEKDARLISGWNLKKLPATVLLRDGEVVDVCYGYQPREILEIWTDSKFDT